MNRNPHSKNKFLHYTISFFLLPAAAGLITGGFVFCFKLLAEHIMDLSHDIYHFVGEHPIYTTLLVPGVCAVAVLAMLFKRIDPASSGGGIPTAIAAMRGILPFKWIRTLICVFFSSLCTFISGVPLDNEGPSVQMGACIGRGVSKLTGKRFKGADRYVMTGGACAGIAVATGAPISGIFFALEDSHRRFTPTLFISASVGVFCGVFSASLLERICGISFSHFLIPEQAALDFQHIWIVILIAVMAVVINHGILFAFECSKKVKERITAISPFARKLTFAASFVIMALCGVVLPDLLGTGHHLTDEVILGNRVWYILVIAIVVRGIFISAASVGNAAGGLFVPLITFGAMTGALCAKILIGLGVIPPELYGALVVMGIGAFLSVAHKTPITAILFTVEIFGGISNALYLILSVSVAYILSELLNAESINDAVMEHRIEKAHRGKTAEIIDTVLTVKPDAFVIGLETRDILWPASCRVLNIRHSPSFTKSHAHGMQEGDKLHMHFLTYDFNATANELCALLGEQNVPREYSSDMLAQKQPKGV